METVQVKLRCIRDKKMPFAEAQKNRSGIFRCADLDTNSLNP